MLRFGFAAIAALLLMASAAGAQIPAQATQPAQASQTPVATPRPPPEGVTVFGSELFSGSFASARPGARPEYLVQPGDQVAVRVFGAVNVDAVQTVDPNGRLFIQGVGPIDVGGSQAGQLQDKVTAAIRQVYTSAVNVYVNIVSGGTLGVFVSGDVNRPGRFVGSPDDSVMYYLDQAGGIDSARGSFRNIVVRRKGKEVGRYDLYDFLLKGESMAFRFQDGDTILVGPRGPTVTVQGDVRNAHVFEVPAGQSTILGRDLLALARPKGATSLTVTTTRDGLRNGAVYPAGGIDQLQIGDSAQVVARAEVYTETIGVSVLGEVKGRNAFVLPRGAMLSQLLPQIQVDDSDVFREYVHIERASVAAAQKEALDRALDSLVRAVITQPSLGAEESSGRSQDIAALQAYIAQARQVKTQGKVAVYVDGQFHDVRLEPGDVIVFPRRTDVVLVAGEVLSPGAFTHGGELTARDYVARAGGVTQSGNRKNLVLRRADGTALVAQPNAKPKAGDEIVITPSFGNQKIRLFRDLTQIAFQIATTAAVIINVSR